jgi:hypothetical protein
MGRQPRILDCIRAAGSLAVAGLPVLLWGWLVVSGVEVSAGFSVLATWWAKAKRRPARFFRSYLDLCILTKQNCLSALNPGVVQTDFTGGKQVTLGGDVLQMRSAWSAGGDDGGDDGDLPVADGQDVRQTSFDGSQPGLLRFGGIVPDHLGDCAGVWKGDKGGIKRPVGCGDRVRCPLCADYYHGTQAREGIAMVLSVLDGCDSAGVVRDIWGEHIELTLPKDLSAAVDALLNLDYGFYRDKVNKLRQAAWRCVNRAVLQACRDADMPAPGDLGGVIVFHHWGSSIPWQPHYHFHVYLLPYTADRQKGEGDLLNWRALPRWWSKDALAVLRSSWKKAAERVLQSHYDGEWNVNRGYLDKQRKLLHFMGYQMRAPMRDLWKGVRSDGNNGFEYHVKGKVGRPGKVMPISADDFRAANDRAYLVGREVTRVTWYGLLANARQTNTMKQLGLDLVSDDDNSAMSNKARYWRPVDDSELGVLFKATDGSEEVDFVAWDKLQPNPVPGPCDKPIGARRRRRWIRPGVGLKVP